MLRVGYTLKIQTTPAVHQYKSEPAKMTVRRTENGVQMRSDPVKLKLDNRAFWDALGMRSLSAQEKEQQAAGKRAVEAFMARQAREKTQMRGPDGLSQAEIAGIPAQRPASRLVFIPEQGPEIRFEGGTVDISYTPDEVDIRWQTGGVTFRYIPYQVEIAVEKWLKPEGKPHAD